MTAGIFVPGVLPGPEPGLFAGPEPGVFTGPEPDVFAGPELGVFTGPEDGVFTGPEDWEPVGTHPAGATARSAAAIAREARRCPAEWDFRSFFIHMD